MTLVVSIRGFCIGLVLLRFYIWRSRSISVRFWGKTAVSVRFGFHLTTQQQSVVTSHPGCAGLHAGSLGRSGAATRVPTKQPSQEALLSCDVMCQAALVSRSSSTNRSRTTCTFKGRKCELHVPADQVNMKTSKRKLGKICSRRHWRESCGRACSKSISEAASRISIGPSGFLSPHCPLFIQTFQASPSPSHAEGSAAGTIGDNARRRRRGHVLSTFRAQSRH